MDYRATQLLLKGEAAECASVLSGYFLVVYNHCDDVIDVYGIRTG